ncbi:MAG: hypothetical protein GXY61_08475 [Lentisphaerae bacterium]|nr:hypothetical protein [Lentisphaerota bacterium]
MLAIELRRPEVVALIFSAKNPVQAQLDQKASLPDGRQFDAIELARMYRLGAVLDILNDARK